LACESRRPRAEHSRVPQLEATGRSFGNSVGSIGAPSNGYANSEASLLSRPTFSDGCPQNPVAVPTGLGSLQPLPNRSARSDRHERRTPLETPDTIPWVPWTCSTRRRPTAQRKPPESSLNDSRATTP
jgi:hypothetical protein